MKLTSENVSNIFEKCLFKDKELVEGKPAVTPAVGKGILNDFGFHPDRIASHKKDISDMLNQLPDSFKKSKGGGMSFLNACMTKDDVQWGEHTNMEQLFALGSALKLVTYPMPREMWSMLPGGMPYVTVNEEI